MLTIGDHIFTRAELLAWRADAPDEALDENARAALDFCQRWLAGQQEFVVQTSGSTGAPKPIALGRQQMAASAQATAAALGLAAGDAVLVCLATRYIAGRMMLARGLVLDMPMTLVPPAANPLDTLPTTRRFAFTAVAPLQLQTLLADARPQTRVLLGGMKAILVGGGPVSPALVAATATESAPVFHTYGMTETATHIALRRLNGPEASDAFTPLPGVHLRLDKRGCLAIAGPMTAGLWVQTNDLVDLQPDGAFRWLGRWDNVINTGGVKVQVEQVERSVAALHLPELAGARFFIAGLPDERLGQMVTLVVERSAEYDEERVQQLLSALRAALDRFAAPRRVITVPRFAETPTGKIDRVKSIEIERG